MDTPPPAPASPPVTGPRVLLGAFILWQLVFLVVINFLEVINSARDEMKDKDFTDGVARVFPGWPSKEGHFHDLADVADKVTRRYAQLTGQSQGWQLFAPDIGRHSVFPAVLVRWDADPRSAPGVAGPLGPLAARNPLESAALWAALRAPSPPAPVTILSDNEPADINHFIRLGLFRLRRLESNLTVILRVWGEKGEKGEEKETLAEARERWRTAIYELLNKDGDVAQAYLRWRWESYRKAHPDAPAPQQLILVMRRYAIVPPEKAPPHWEGPFTEPVARLQPAVRWGADGNPRLEMYNPVTQRFQEVAR